MVNLEGRKNLLLMLYVVKINFFDIYDGCAAVTLCNICISYGDGGILEHLCERL